MMTFSSSSFGCEPTFKGTYRHLLWWVWKQRNKYLYIYLLHNPLFLINLMIAFICFPEVDHHLINWLLWVPGTLLLVILP